MSSGGKKVADDGSSKKHGKKKVKDNSNRLLNESVDEAVMHLIERICLQEEEEYQNMKADWLDTCHADATREACHSNMARVSFHKDSVPADSISSSISSSPFTPSSSTSSSSFPSSSSISKKVKAKRKVSFGDICEVFKVKTKIPDCLVRAQTIYCCRTALTHYNMKHGTNYKLVEPLLSGRAPDSQIGLHCNFTAAKLKKNNVPSAPKLFYADFRCSNTKATNIQCCIVDAAKALHKTCRGCPPDLAHCPCKRHRHWLYFPIRGEGFNSGPFGPEAALDWYNDKHGTAYELVKPVGSYSRVIGVPGRRCHCNFTAKQLDDTSPKFFFADFLKSTSITILDCRILNTADTLDSVLHLQVDLEDHCWFCPRTLILHPPNYKGPKRWHLI